MTPRLSGQVDALERAYRDAEVPPNTVGYIEAHGTATPVGDLTEIAALKKNVKGNGEGPVRCAVASVKGNIGHALAASGIAGLIRAVLAVNHRVIPPQAGLQSVRAELGLEGSGFHIPAAPQPFEAHRGVPRRAGVSAWAQANTASRNGPFTPSRTQSSARLASGVAFSALTGVRSMNETYPLARVAEAYDRMMSGEARFRVVLTMDG